MELISTPLPSSSAYLTSTLHNMNGCPDAINIRNVNYFAIESKKFRVRSNCSGEPSDATEDALFSKRFDVIIGNPPYTRWTDIDTITKGYIRQYLTVLAKEYGIPVKSKPGREGSMPGSYVYWILQSDRLLKDHGRIGVIISDLWLQNNYGKGVQRFLLGN